MPPEWGNVPEWVAGIGSLAAFGALYIAAREWRSAGGTPGFGGRPASRCQGAEAANAERKALTEAREAERRDHEHSQARLLIVEPMPFEDPTWGGVDPPPASQRRVVVRNYSGSPVFRCHVEEYPAEHDDVRVSQIRRGGVPNLADYPCSRPDTVGGEPG